MRNEMNKYINLNGQICKFLNFDESGCLVVEANVRFGLDGRSVKMQIRVDPSVKWNWIKMK